MNKKMLFLFFISQLGFFDSEVQNLNRCKYKNDEYVCDVTKKVFNSLRMTKE